MTSQLRAISAEEHRQFIEDRAADAGPPVSFLQTPAWAAVKPEWESESIGWFENRELIGAGLVLYRKLPRMKSYLAYLPEGPVLDWSREDLPALLELLVQHVKNRGSFGVRIGPTVVHRRWHSDTIKGAIADDAVTSLSQVSADETDLVAVRVANTLHHLGWRPPADEEGFAAGQPQFNFQLPLAHPDGTAMTSDEVLKGMNQQWRRNIKKADKAGVVVRHGARDDLREFHRLYLITAARDGFTPRPLRYFETMWDALNAENPDRMRVYLASHEGDTVAATTWIGLGRHCWYSYGASSNEKREVRGSNAVQWQMIQDSLDGGAQVYDLRGITPGVGSDDPEIGLIRFKVGTGGEAVAYLGEWDLPLNRVLYKAFDVYMARRG